MSQAPKKGLFVGKSHAEGGIPSKIAETGQLLEIEGDEYYICKQAYQSTKQYKFENKTNKQILDKIYTDFSCTLKQSEMHANDFIVCKVVVKDPTPKNRTGTVAEILNQMQAEKSCKVESQHFLLRKGGFICPQGTEIQSLIFEKSKFNNGTKAKNWAKKHGFKATKLDEKDNTYRIRQQTPKSFKDNTFRTIDIDGGIKAVIGCPIKMEDGGALTTREQIIEIAKNSKNVDEAYKKTLSLQVSKEDADWFSDTYNPNKNLTPQQAYLKLYNEVNYTSKKTPPKKNISEVSESLSKGRKKIELALQTLLKYATESSHKKINKQLVKLYAPNVYEKGGKLTLKEGDNTNLGVIQEVYNDQYKINGSWYHHSLVKPSSEPVAPQKIKNRGVIAPKHIISAFANPIDQEKVEDYENQFKHLGLSHKFPPIKGYPDVITEEDFGDYFINGIEITENDLGTYVWKVTDGHHRSHAALNAGLPYIHTELDTTALADEELYLQDGGQLPADNTNYGFPPILTPLK